MKKLFLNVLFLLCGCTGDHIHTEIYSDMCIKPFKEYIYLTCHDIEFSINGEIFLIPHGFKTDLASIPKIVWPIMAPAHSSLIRPAIVHDWFYRKTCDFDRKNTDLIFYHMLVNDGVPIYKSLIMYYAVRIFGWNFYNKDHCDG